MRIFFLHIILILLPAICFGQLTQHFVNFAGIEYYQSPTTDTSFTNRILGMSQSSEHDGDGMLMSFHVNKCTNPSACIGFLNNQGASFIYGHKPAQDLQSYYKVAEALISIPKGIPDNLKSKIQFVVFGQSYVQFPTCTFNSGQMTKHPTGGVQFTLGVSENAEPIYNAYVKIECTTPMSLILIQNSDSLMNGAPILVSSLKLTGQFYPLVPPEVKPPTTEPGTEVPPVTEPPDEPEEPQKNPVPPSQERTECPGSVINMDNLSFGEKIPVVGTPFSLVYSSEYAKQFATRYRNVSRESSFNPEGWSISHVHYYNSQEDRLFLGTGVSIVKESVSLGGGLRMVTHDDEVYIFDQNGKHIQTKGSLTGYVKYEMTYNSGGRLVAITDSYALVTAFNRNANNRLISIVGPYGQTTTIQGGGILMIGHVINPNNEKHRIWYHPQSELMSDFLTPGGKHTKIEYGLYGRLTNTINRRSSNSYRGLYLPQSTEIVANIAGKFLYLKNQFDQDGNYIRRINRHSGRSSVYTERPDGTSIQDLESKRTEIQNADDLRFGSAVKTPSRIIEKISGVTRTTEMKHIAIGLGSDPFLYSQLKAKKTINGNEWITLFDRSSGLFSYSSPEGVNSYKKIDSKENIVEMGLSHDTPWSFEYDQNGRLKKSYQGARHLTEYQYDVRGNLSEVKNSLGHRTLYSYDLLERVVGISRNGYLTTYEYNPDGYLTGVTPADRPKHIFDYESIGFLRSYQPPTLANEMATRTFYGYGAGGGLLEILAPPNKEPIMFAYDLNNQRLRRIQMGNVSQSYQYFPESDNVKEVVSFDGIKSRFDYFGSRVSAEKQESPTLYSTITFDFNNNFLPIKRRISADFLPKRSEIIVGYNKDGQIQKIGDLEISYLSGTGRVGQTKLQNIVDTYTYDNYGNILSYKAEVNNPEAGALQIYSYSFERDTEGRIVKKVETVGEFTNIYEYKFDVLGRLASVSKDGVLHQEFEYDGNGNRIRIKRSNLTVLATYDNQDRLIAFGNNHYEYSSSGELLSRSIGILPKELFNFDSFGSLKAYQNSSGKKIKYMLDAQQRPVEVISESTTRKRIFEDKLRLAMEYREETRKAQEFIYALSINSPDYMLTDGIKYRFIKDHLGSPRLIIRADNGEIVQKISYDVWGNILEDTNRDFQPFGFAGGIIEKNMNMLKFGARYYDPVIGRWISKDPILFDGGDSNLYGYVLGDPINFFDPSGHRYNITIPARPTNYGHRVGPPDDQGPLDPGDFCSWDSRYCPEKPFGSTEAKPKKESDVPLAHCLINPKECDGKKYDEGKNKNQCPRE